MEKQILVYVNDSPVFKFTIKKTSEIGFIRKYLEKEYPSYAPRFYINPKTELKVLKDDKYDGVSFESVFSKMKNPFIQLWNKKALTGDKRVDLLILSNLEDRDLLNFCLTNKYAKDLCEEESFWENRFFNKFGEDYLEYKPDDNTWKQYYLNTISILSKWENPWLFFDEVSWNILDSVEEGLNFKIKNRLVPYSEEIGQKLVTAYLLLNLGKTIRISFPRDRYQELEPEVREYSDELYFSPVKVLKLIEEFYDELVTKEELEEHQEIDNPYASDHTEADLGKIRRRDLIPLFFEGFVELDDGSYMIEFGS